MSPRTATLPPTEPAMWRKLLAAVHPDRGGSHDLFVRVTSLRESIVEGNGSAAPSPPPRPQPQPQPEASRTEEPDCIPFDTYLDFDEITEAALDLADGSGYPYAAPLRLLHDCEEAFAGPLRRQQEKGATYKQLAPIAYAVGMSKSQRVEWYRIAEDIPLSRRHAGHILSKLR